MDVVLDYGNCCYTYMTKGRYSIVLYRFKLDVTTNNKEGAENKEVCFPV